MNCKAMLSVCLAAVLAAPAGWAQQVSGPRSNIQAATPAAPAPQPGTLKIVAIEGEGAVNNVRTHTATQPVVEVRDAADKPVAGAEVIFQLPAAGPGGVFYNWMRTQTAKTDEQGRAAATGFTANEEEGRFNIKVMANRGADSGTLIIGQSNGRGGTGAAAATGSRKILYTILGLAAVGGIAGGIAGTRGGSTATTTPTTPVTVTPGAVTVGNPR